MSTLQEPVLDSEYLTTIMFYRKSCLYFLCALSPSRLLHIMFFASSFCMILLGFEAAKGTGASASLLQVQKANDVGSI
jgi:hypothetical protein